MDFALTTMFVVPVGNTLPTAGSSEDLTDGKFGIFQDDARTIATAATVPTADYIQLIQGRPSSPYQSKRSHEIFSKNIKSFYKTVAKAAQVEIWEISDFNVPVTDSVSLTLVGHSKYLDGLYVGGFRKTYTIPAGCLECGADPCTVVPNEDVIDAFIARYNEDVAQAPDAANIPAFYTFAKVGTGDDAVLRITAKPYTEEGVPCDPALNPYNFDRMWFKPNVYLGADTTADFIVEDDCPVPATTTLTQKSNYAVGTAAEVKALETRYRSYQSGFKTTFQDPGFNPDAESLVDDGTTYNVYYLQYNRPVNFTWNDHVYEDLASIVAVPAGSATDTAMTTILTAFYKAPQDKTGTAGGDMDLTLP